MAKNRVQILRNRSDIHWERKLWHVLTVFSMFCVYQMVSSSTSFLILLVGIILFVSIDIARHRHEKVNDWVISVMGPIMRQSEVHKMAGTTYLLGGVLFCVIVFRDQKDIVALTLLFLAFADPLASYVGLRFGKDKIFRQKTLQGFLAAYFVCFLSSLIFLSFKDYPTPRVMVFSVIAGLLGALAELLPIGDLDDNLTLPIISSIGIYVLFYFFGFLTQVV